MDDVSSFVAIEWERTSRRKLLDGGMYAPDVTVPFTSGIFEYKSFDESLVAYDDLYLESMMSKLSVESVDDFVVVVVVEFLSNGLTLSIGLKSGFLTISGSALQKTLEELIAVNDDSLSVLTDVVVVVVVVVVLEVADDSSVFVVIDGKFGFVVSVVSVVADGFIVIALKIEVPDESVFVLPRFLFAKSYLHCSYVGRGKGK